MKKWFAVLALISISFFAGWSISPGVFKEEFETTTNLKVYGGSNGLKEIGVLPVGTRLLSDGYVAPDVGFEGCVVIDFGNSLSTPTILRHVDSVSTSLSSTWKKRTVFLSASPNFENTDNSNSRSSSRGSNNRGNSNDDNSGKEDKPLRGGSAS